MRDEVAATAEGRRLTHSSSDGSAWRRWGPYLSARQWGTVREDYTDNGDAWNAFPFDTPICAPTGGVRTVWVGSPTGTAS